MALLFFAIRENPPINAPWERAWWEIQNNRNFHNGLCPPGWEWNRHTLINGTTIVISTSSMHTPNNVVVMAESTNLVEVMDAVKAEVHGYVRRAETAQVHCTLHWNWGPQGEPTSVIADAGFDTGPLQTVRKTWWTIHCKRLNWMGRYARGGRGMPAPPAATQGHTPLPPPFQPPTYPPPRYVLTSWSHLPDSHAE
jgi:hypothetical protein